MSRLWGALHVHFPDVTILAGLGIITQLVARDNVIIFAGARNPSTATNLQALVQKHPGKFHVVKVVSSDKAGNEAAVAEVKKIAGRLDVVIANVGEDRNT